jgi:predicted DNA-binding transcriptional regulator AlpA
MAHKTSSPPSADDPVLRRNDAAAYVGLSLPAFDRLTRSGQLPRIKLGKAVGCRRSWLNSYLDSLTSSARGNE